MNRRRFLVATGVGGSLGLLGAGGRYRERPPTVAVWSSERAARYDALGERATGYLGAALGGLYGEVDLDLRERAIALESEQGTRLVEVEWPRMVPAGGFGTGPVRPVGEVNLLVTDGDPGRAPAGYGMRSIAAVSGARFLAAMSPADGTPPVVPYSAPPPSPSSCYTSTDTPSG